MRPGGIEFKPSGGQAWITCRCVCGLGLLTMRCNGPMTTPAAHDWFSARARSIGMETTVDPYGAHWAWWPASPEPGVVAGGSFENVAGLAAAFDAAEHVLRDGHRPRLPVGVLARPAGDRAVSTAASDWLRQIGGFVELQTEHSGRLAAAGAPLGVATGTWAQGRWRFEFSGVAAHPGTPFANRQDPTLDAARFVLATHRLGAELQVLTTVTRVDTGPGHESPGQESPGQEGPGHGVPGAVRAWLDARAASQPALLDLVAELVRAAAEAGATVTEENWVPALALDPDLRDRIGDAVDAAQSAAGAAPMLTSCAGGTAGALTAAGVAAGQILVRTSLPGHGTRPAAPGGAPADREAGVRALGAVLRELSS
jgi:hypothetical protein